MLASDVLHEVAVAVPARLLPHRATPATKVLVGDLVMVIPARSEVEAGNLGWGEGGVTGAGGESHGDRRAVLGKA
ncbi:hypothetical protein ON010_g14108 [Phytophthora cinnamomi]|nr:hypothetical protein ON010_g14108 [Phytophthora cinnamomi]